MLTAFRSFIAQNQLLSQNSVTLLAVSGGVDSVVMSSLFYHARLHFAIAHCNFGLRGVASNQDEAFVRALAQRYQVNFYAQAFNASTVARTQGISIQMAARALRYAWFQELSEQHGFEKVATAHHSQDNLETILLQFTKGTGIAGLRGILPAQGHYVRPLLFASKEEILHYAHTAGITWREDRSNDDNRYQRNLIRHQVIPWLKKLNPNLTTTLQRTLVRIRQTEALFNEQVAQIRQKTVRNHAGIYYIAVQEIQTAPWASVVIWELLKPFGFNFSQVDKLLAHKHMSGTMFETAQYRLYVDRAHWMIIPHTTSNHPAYAINCATTMLTTPSHTLQCVHIRSTQHTITASHEIAALDGERLHFPLEIRQWQPGDTFYPLGMEKRKKLSDFLVDNKIPVPLKADVWVVTSAGDIVWVIGHRIDNRFKITANTKQVYEIHAQRRTAHPLTLSSDIDNT